MAFPSHVALQSDYNKKFLCLPDEVEGRPRGYLQFSGDLIYGARSQLEFEWSESDSGLVHIRCLYNNKYWQRLKDGWICATAELPEENETKMSCTLFKPIQSSGGIQLQHVQSGCYAILSRDSAVPFSSCLSSRYTYLHPSGDDVFKMIDLEQMLIVPRNSAFKGDNGKYLRFITTNGQPHLQFSSHNATDVDAVFDVKTNDDGTIKLQHICSYKYWSLDSSKSILVNSGFSGDKTSFSTFKVDDDVVALRSLSNNRFCKRFTKDGRVDCLSAEELYVDDYAKLQVVEVLISRRIYNVKFRIDDARIYNKSDVVLAEAGAINNTDKPTNQDAKLSYSDSKTSSSWKSIASTKLKSVPTTLESSIPRVDYGNMRIQLSGQFKEKYQWGVTREWNTPICSYDVSLSVPPRTKVGVKVIATICSYDVPFSYTQRDADINGHIYLYNMDDGKYTGTNYLNIKSVTTEEKLQGYEDPLPH